MRAVADVATPLSPSPTGLTSGGGSFDTQRAFLGSIDEVALFADEVQQLYEAGVRGLRLAK